MGRAGRPRATALGRFINARTGTLAIVVDPGLGRSVGVRTLFSDSRASESRANQFGPVLS